MPIIQPITLCGSKQLRRPEIRACIQTWSRLKGVAPFVILDDGTLEQQDVDELSVHGCIMLRTESRERVDRQLEAYPHLVRLRRESIYFRKIIDPALACPKADYLLWVDTDVFFTERCALAPPEHDFVYGVDDASCYGGSWRAALRHPMLLGLNAGFLLFARTLVNLELLEELAVRYFLPLTPPFRPTMEQTAWSILGARAPGHAAAFSGHDYRIVNGLAKRTPEQHRGNRIQWWSHHTGPADIHFARRLVEGAAVIHFAGSGRQFIQPLSEMLGERYRSDAAPRTLHYTAAAPAGALDRTLLATRMALSHRSWMRRQPHLAQPSAPATAS